MKNFDTKNIILAILMIAFHTTLEGAPITANQAKQIACDFISGGKMKVNGNRQIELAYTQSMISSKKESLPAFYVFNIDKSSYVIISADDATESVLAYCDNNPFKLDDIPDNLRAWLDGYAEEIAWASMHDYNPVDAPMMKAKKNINPLVKSTWNQTEPFNNQCVFNNTRCYTGCVATAMAQIMYYWATTGKDGKKFKGGSTALAAYTTDTKKYHVPKKGALSSFAWSDMTNGTPSTTAGKEAVATLMRYCGQAVEMDYTGTDQGSAAEYDDALAALKHNFSYNFGMSLVYSDEMTSSEWSNMIYNQLNEGKPVMMSGNSGTEEKYSAHAFICDGYNATDNKYHFNWGWGGQHDGYFKMTSLKPASGENYSFNKYAIINIQPLEDSNYALLSTDGKTLTFYSDANRKNREGTVYDTNTLEEDEEKPGWYMKTSIMTVKFASSFANAKITSTAGWFKGLKNLTTVSNTKNLNMSEVEYADEMFYGCTSLKSLDVSSFYMEKIQSSHDMFGNCSVLSNLKISSSMNKLANDAFLGVGKENAPCTVTAPEEFNFGTDTNKPMFTWKGGYFFSGNKVPYSYVSDGKMFLCYDEVPWSHGVIPYALGKTPFPTYYSIRESITEVEIVNSFANARPTNTTNWFYGMTNLTKIIGLHYLNTSEVTNMDRMFYKCIKLRDLNLGSFNTSKVKSAERMVNECSSIKDLDVSMFDLSNANNTDYMFASNTSLRHVSVSKSMENLSNDAFSNVGKASNPCYIDAPKGFNFDTNTSEDYFEWKNGYFTIPRKAYAVIDGERLTFHYDATSESRTGNVLILDENSIQPVWESFKESITHISFDKTFSHLLPTSTASWFENMTNLKSIEGIECLNTSEVTTMEKMFKNCQSLENVDLSHFNTSKVESMEQMFYGCSHLKGIDLTSFDSGKVSKIRYMFYLCNNLEKLDLGNFNTSNVTNMDCVFYDCNSLEHLNLSSFDTSKVRTMSFMFGKCGSLKTLDVSNFDTSMVTDMGSMFNGCKSLTDMDVSHFNMNSVEKCDYMFFLCEKLQHVKLPTSIKGIGEYMFRSCYKLQDIFLPEGLTRIGNNAFDRCNALVSVKVGFTSPLDISENVFSNRFNANLIVPDNTRMSFASAAYWKDFLNIYEASEATGIAVTIPVTEEVTYFNINGTPVKQPQHGIYIKNGKKVLVK